MNNVSHIGSRMSCAGFQSCLYGPTLRAHGSHPRRVVISLLQRATLSQHCSKPTWSALSNDCNAGYIQGSRWRRSFSFTRFTQARQQKVTAPPPTSNGSSAPKKQDHRALTWRDYDPEGGLPLPSGDVSQSTITNIFGPDVDIEAGNWILRLLHFRRQSGSLIDLGLDFPAESGVSRDMAFKALTYLRNTQPPFDENEAGAAWAEMETQKLEDEYMKRSEAVGIYKKTEDEVEVQYEEPEYQPGDSALVALRKRGQARFREEERRKEELEKEREARALAEYGLKEELAADSTQTESDPTERNSQASPEHGAQDVVLHEPSAKAWLQPVDRKPWVKYYEEQATLVKDNVVPQMSLARRLGPSALFVLAILGFCYYLHEHYVPPPRSARLLPDVPPAVATIGALMAANLGVFLAYRFPPFWRTINRYFISVPGYPMPTSMALAMFTHTSFVHMAVNSFVLLIFGRYLHEDVGRGSFLAIYLGSGVVGGFSFLAYNAVKMNWVSYACGSSTAVYGVLAAACLLRANHDATFFGYNIPATGLTILSAFIGAELIASRSASLAKHIDFTGHFTGLAAGVIAAALIRWEATHKEMVRVDAPPETIDTE